MKAQAETSTAQRTQRGNLQIHKVGVRDRLPERREPYWGPAIDRGLYLGFRKIDAHRGSWVARLRLDDSNRLPEDGATVHTYHRLGPVTETYDFEKARDDARQWVRNRNSGVPSERVTVEQCCRQYVEDRRREKGDDCAHDAEKRFERTVYGTTFGATDIAKLRTAAIKAWRDGLKLSKASANRTMTVLRAALNLAVENRLVPSSQAIEWQSVKQHKKADKRRSIFLDLEQRRALLKACEGSAVHDLIAAAMYTGARAGELISAKVSQFDSRMRTMHFDGKTGGRDVVLAPAAVDLFTRLSRSKLPGAFLLTRDDGEPWAHSDWDELVRAAAEKSGLPRGTCLYTLRHSFISQLLSDGLPTLTVSKMVGTSLLMIQQHYGHIADKTTQERMAQVVLA